MPRLFWSQHIRQFIVMCLAIAFAFLAAAVSFAQIQTSPAPEFTSASLETNMKAVEANPDLSEEQKLEITGILRTASESLQKATENIADKNRFGTQTANAPVTLKELSESIEKAQDEIARKQDALTQGGDLNGVNDVEPLREEDLLQLERDLIATESELEAVRLEVDGYDRGLESLNSRQALAPVDLDAARTSLGQVAISLSELGAGDLDVLAEAQRKSLQSREYFRSTQIDMLEQEILSLSVRQEIVTARKNLADIRLQELIEDVQYLQNATGEKRKNDANIIKTEAIEIAKKYKDLHVVVRRYAAENVEISEEIVELAKNAADQSKRSANIVSLQDGVKNDLRIAEDFIQSGNLDRLSGETLRRLSNQLLPPTVIQGRINTTRKNGIALTHKKLLTQDRLRSMTPGRTDVEEVYKRAKSLDSQIPPLTEEDTLAYSELYNQRREYLTQITALATTQTAESSDLQSNQIQLLDDTQTLRNLLDEKLLWVPSVPAINFAWPEKVLKGGSEIFSGGKLQATIGLLFKQGIEHVLLTLGIIIVILGVARMRPIIWANVAARAGKIGRVKDDSAWHTPVTVVAGMLMALPLPMVFGLFGLLLDISNSTDTFVNGLSEGFYCLAVLSFIFITWLRWDRDDSLFGAHFNLPTDIRCIIFNNLKWFFPVTGVLTTLLTLTSHYSSDNIYEGFSLFIFILLSLSLSIFSARIFYRRKTIMDNLFLENATLHNFRNIIVGVAVFFPILTAIFAAIGYYASAYELLYSAFLTGGTLLLAYVIYGIIKRAITVAQRQILYRQAMDRREAELKARAEKIKAEQLGEDAPPLPPLDTETIDVSSVTRQSLQLLNTIIVLVTVLFLWMNWSSLLPALTIFDGFELGSINTGLLDEDGREIIRSVTLWTVLQSSLILILTFIAAKNFPSFTEIFVLSRLGVDSGVRYAVKTIMGYVIIAFGVIWAFNKIGLQWSQLRWVVTGLSVGIGFGLQKIIANFISGLIILFERPVRIGDYVTIGDQSGTVSKIKIRATTLNDLDNREILIPNEALISERVTNWTLSNSITRLIVPVGIAYGSDTDGARDIMLDAVKALPKILDMPAPQVLFIGFGDSSLDFEVRVFLSSFEELVPMRHVVHTEINKALAAAGFAIPFPQRDLNIVSQGVPLAINTAQSPKKPKT